MKELATWFLATAVLTLGLAIAWLANQNHARAELGVCFVRTNGDLVREVARLELVLEASRADLEQRIREGRPLPYEEAVAPDPEPFPEVAP